MRRAAEKNVRILATASYTFPSSRPDLDIDMRVLVATLMICCLFVPAVRADLYNDMLFLNLMNESSCTGQGGTYTGMTCRTAGKYNKPRYSAEELAWIKERERDYVDAKKGIFQALNKPLSPTRFERLYPEIPLPKETPETARVFTCFRQRIAGILLSEHANSDYKLMISASSNNFDTRFNVRDVYYWTQDIAAILGDDPRFLLDLNQPDHRKFMIDLVLREAPRAWEEAHKAVAMHDPDMITIDPRGTAKPYWFLVDSGFVYRSFDEDPSVQVGRSYYFPASCKNHWNSARAKLIPVTGYYMDDRAVAFAEDPAAVGITGILPFDFPE